MGGFKIFWVLLCIGGLGPSNVFPLKENDAGASTADEDAELIVDINDHNKTQYLSQNFDAGNYKFGYDIRPSGPLGQFHHENKAPDDIVYGCFGYIDPNEKDQITFYVADAWGFRPVAQQAPTEIFYPAENPEGTTDMKGTVVQWTNLDFPAKCTYFADKIEEFSKVKGYDSPKLLSQSAPLVTRKPTNPAEALGINTVNGKTPSSSYSRPGSTYSPPVTTANQRKPIRGRGKPKPVTQDGTTVGPKRIVSSNPRPYPSQPTNRVQTDSPSNYGEKNYGSALYNEGIVPSSPPISKSPTSPTRITKIPVRSGSISPNRSNGKNYDQKNNPIGIYPVGESGYPQGSQSTTPSYFGSKKISNPPSSGNYGYGGVAKSNPSNAGVTTGSKTATTSYSTPSKPEPTPTTSSEEFNRNVNFISGGNEFAFPKNYPAGAATHPQKSVDAGIRPEHDVQGSSIGVYPSNNPYSSGGSNKFQPSNSDNNKPRGSESQSNVPSSGDSIGSRRHKNPSSHTGDSNGNNGNTVPTSQFQPLSEDRSSNSGAFYNNDGNNDKPDVQQNQPNTNAYVDGSSTGFYPSPQVASNPYSHSRTPVDGSDRRSNSPNVGSRPSNGYNSGSGGNNPYLSASRPLTANQTYNIPNSNQLRPGNSYNRGSPQNPNNYNGKPLSRESETLFGYSGPFAPEVTPGRGSSFSQSEDNFCSTQCGACNGKPQFTDPIELQYAGIPGSVVANVPVIFYPDCEDNAFRRPAIVPFCPSNRARNERQAETKGIRTPLTMRFPSATVPVERSDMPTARNSAYVVGTMGGNSKEIPRRKSRSSVRVVKRARRLKKNAA